MIRVSPCGAYCEIVVSNRYSLLFQSQGVLKQSLDSMCVLPPCIKGRVGEDANFSPNLLGGQTA